MVCFAPVATAASWRAQTERHDNRVQAEQVYAVKERLDPFEDSTVVVDDRLYAFAPLPLCFAVSDGSRLWSPCARRAAATKPRPHTPTATFILRNQRLDHAHRDKCQGIHREGAFHFARTAEFLRSHVSGRFRWRADVRDNDRLYCFDVSRQPDTAPKPQPTFLKWEVPAAPGVPRAAAPAGPLPQLAAWPTRFLFPRREMSSSAC